MSDNILRLVPHDPDFRPSEDAIAVSLGIWREVAPAAESIAAESEDGGTFFGAGENAESIACPSCGADLQRWWGDAMDQASKSRFENLSVATPCCQRATSLNDLVYVWPAAFGSFALAMTNPGIPTIADEQHKRIEQALGSPLKVIWQHI